MGKEKDGVCNYLAAGSWDVGFVAAVVVRKIDNLPSVHDVLRPDFAFLGGFIDQSFDTQWCHGIFFAIKLSLNVC